MAFSEWLNSNRTSCRATLEEFKTRFEKDPANAFEWGMAYMQSAARLRVFEIVQNQINADLNLDDIRERAIEAAVRVAQFPKMSTSATANLMQTYEGQAWAMVAEAIRWRE